MSDGALLASGACDWPTTALGHPEDKGGGEPRALRSKAHLRSSEALANTDRQTNYFTESYDGSLQTYTWSNFGRWGGAERLTVHIHF